MPGRPERTMKVDSPEVQGDDSYVILRKLEVHEVRKLSETSKRQHWSDYKVGQEFMALRIVDWNWVDDDKEPLPLPKDDPKVMDRLTEDEMIFLNRVIQESLPDIKN